MKIDFNDKEITFTFPRFKDRHNPYMSDEEQYGEYPIFTGLIVNHKEYKEMGFAYTIDMNYKGKDDQVGDFAVMWDKDEKSFTEKCEELKINVYEIEAS